MRQAGVGIGKGSSYLWPIMVLDLTEDEKIAPARARI